MRNEFNQSRNSLSSSPLPLDYILFALIDRLLELQEGALRLWVGHRIGIWEPQEIKERLGSLYQGVMEMGIQLSLLGHVGG